MISVRLSIAHACSGTLPSGGSTIIGRRGAGAAGAGRTLQGHLHVARERGRGEQTTDIGVISLASERHVEARLRRDAAGRRASRRPGGDGRDDAY